MNGNKLIAEFMGLPLVPCSIGTENGIVYEGYQHPKGGMPFTADGLQYKYSWDWLMPVIHRIRDHVNVDMGFEEFDDWRENFKQIDPYNYSLEQCYKAVVEFIKQYNNE